MEWSDITKQQKIMMFGTLSLIVIVLVVKLISSALMRINDYENQITEIVRNVDGINNKSAEIKISDLENRLNNRRDNANKSLPDTIGAAELLKNFITDYLKIEKYEVSFYSLEPGEYVVGELTEKADGTAKFSPGTLPIHMKFTSSYSGMAKYIKFVENQDWIVSVSSLVIKNNINNQKKGNKLVFDATFDVVTLNKDKGFKEIKKRVDNNILISSLNRKGHKKITELVFYDPAVDGVKAARLVSRSSSKNDNTSQSIAVDGIIGSGVVIDGDIYYRGDELNNWKISRIDLKNYVLFLRQDNSTKALNIRL
ncbi:MAG: hypothetical protein OEM38_05190 [Gammaproteobacteria bacterium]|nr:hypothetical protein [Gammaproteobacteria bacterium]